MAQSPYDFARVRDEGVATRVKLKELRDKEQAERDKEPTVWMSTGYGHVPMNKTVAKVMMTTAPRVVLPIAGTFLGGPKGMLAGAVVGEAMAQENERNLGIRDDYSVAEGGVNVALSMLAPARAASTASTLVRGATPALSGAFIGGAQDVAQRAIRGEEQDPMASLQMAGAGMLMAGGFGAIDMLGKAKVGQQKIDAGDVKKVDPVPEPVKAGDVVELPDGKKVVVTQPVTTTAAVAGEGQVQRGFIKSVKESTEIADPLKQAVDDYYTRQGNAATIAAANKVIDEEGLERSLLKFMGDEAATPEGNALGLELIRRYQGQGDFDKAADVIYAVSRRATTQGQAIQILSTLSKQTPEGSLLYATKVKGGKLTPEEMDRIRELQGRVEQAGSADTKLARSAELFEHINSLTPGELGQKARSLANMAMLLNPKTIVRNVGGNVIMQFADVAADSLAVNLDRGLSIFTGKRSIPAVQFFERARGMAQPYYDFRAGMADAAAQGKGWGAQMQEGLDTMATLARLTSQGKMEIGDIGRAYRTTFSNPVAKGLEKTLSIAMGASDRAFYTAALRASLANKTKLMADGMIAPSTDIMGEASLDAARAIFQDDNFASRSLNGIRKSLNRFSTFGKSEDFGAGQAIVPFSQVPGSILLRGAVDYSPVGYVKALYESVSPVLPNRTFDQKAFLDAFSRATVGTAGIAASGYTLGQLGVATAAPEEDKDVDAMRRAIGWGAYRINASALKRRMIAMDFEPNSELGDLKEGDVLVNYDWAQPIALPLAMGAEVGVRDRLNQKQGVKAVDVQQAAIAGLKAMENQPLLTGLSRFGRDTANMGVISASFNSLLSLPAQFAPAAFNQIGQLTDETVRETRGTTEFETAYGAVASRLPGMAEAMGYPVARDQFGQARERFGNLVGPAWFNTFLNPAFITRIKSSPQANEVLKLYETTGETGQVPRRVPQNIEIMVGGERLPVVLDANQLSTYQKFVGRMTYDMFGQLVQSPQFMGLPDEERAKFMAEVVTDINTAAKVMLFGHRPQAMSKRAAMFAGFSQMNPDLQITTQNVPELGGKLPKQRDTR